MYNLDELLYLCCLSRLAYHSGNVRLQNSSLSTEMFIKNIKRNKIKILFNLNGRNTTTFSLQESVKKLDDYFPSVLGKISSHTFRVPEVVENVKRVAEYSANKEDKLSGAVTLLSYELLARPQNSNQESLNQIRTLAWGAEMVDSYSDILDQLERHPGKTCWRCYEPSLLRSFIYELLRTDFQDKPFYVHLVHLFSKAFLHATAGVYLDFTGRFRNNDNFTIERYNSIVENKTTFSTFKFPVALAMTLTENKDATECNEIEEICSDLGKLYHMRKDYLDCYGAENDYLGIPNHSRQIQDGNCTWLALTALQRLTPAQRIVFMTCYGSKEPAHIERLKLLYDQLQMKKLCKEEEERICVDIERKAKRLRSNSQLVLGVLDLIRNHERESNQN